MLTFGLGAPGSGKSTVALVLRKLMPHRVVFDWDDFMSAARALARRDITSSPDLWPAYGEVVRASVEAAGPSRVVVLGVCTPDELEGWPNSRWILLDCRDDERRRRLGGRSAGDVNGALDDAAAYRSLGFPIVDTTGRTVEAVANEVVAFIAET